jgi:putative transposase
MNTVKIYQLKNLSHTQYQRLREAQQEAALVWNACVALHKDARMNHLKWPGRDALQKATKGRFALHSQSIQPAK